MAKAAMGIVIIALVQSTACSPGRNETRASANTHGMKQPLGERYVETYGITRAGDGSYYIAGAQYEVNIANASVAITTTRGCFEVGSSIPLITRINAQGKVISEKTLPVKAQIQTVLPLTDGGFVVAGAHDRIGWYGRFSGDGELQWEGRLKEASKLWNAASASDRGYLLTGSYRKPNRGVILRLDDSGKILWERVYDQSTRFETVVPSHQGGWIVAGWKHRAPHYWSALLFEIDAKGEIAWERLYPGERSTFPTSVAVMPDGYLVAGRNETESADPSSGAAWLRMVNRQGEEKWSMSYGPRSLIASVFVSEDGKIYAVAWEETEKRERTNFTARIEPPGRIVTKRVFDSHFQVVAPGPKGTAVCAGHVLPTFIGDGSLAFCVDAPE